MDIDPNRMSSLLNLLPAVFQEDPDPERDPRKANFIGRFLLAFEHVLLGLGDRTKPGLEEIIAGVARTFDPVGDLSTEETAELAHLREKRSLGTLSVSEATRLDDLEIKEDAGRAPVEFLPWLAGWLALVLREDWDPQRQRNLIAKAAELYRLRGTRRGIEEFVHIFTEESVHVSETGADFEVGIHSTVGVDTFVGGGAPFFFRVEVELSTPDVAEREAQREVARSIVDLQKPAHTYYQLDLVSKIRFQVGVHSTVGQDTLIG